MLFNNATPPPGYNSPSVNHQTPGPFNIPGQQGHVAQGYFFNPYRSSWSMPSSFSFPSNLPQQQPYYGPPPQVHQMVQALRGKPNG